MLRAEEVSIVAGAFLSGAEGGVGFADFDEALRGGGVVGVEVRVVGFGEFVELSGTSHQPSVIRMSFESVCRTS